MFRATTLASTLMEQYMKATATPFVHHALKDTILKIMESKQSCEVQRGWRRVRFSSGSSFGPSGSWRPQSSVERKAFFLFPLKLNPSKLEKNEDVNLNLSHLLNILSELVEKIFMAAEILPP